MPSAASDPTNPKLVAHVANPHISNLISFQTLMADERTYQQHTFGDTFDSKNTPNDWIAYITSYAGMAVTKPFDPIEFRKRLVQVATICAAAYDHCERSAGKMAARHYDEQGPPTKE